VIAYASRSLTVSERKYNENVLLLCSPLNNFSLGRSFQIHTDHEPLQWLLAQKMEGMLCRWALAMQEYDFTIVGSANTNADALSWLTPPSCALTVSLPHYSLPELEKAQILDPIISVIHKARLQSCDVLRDTAVPCVGAKCCGNSWL